MAKSSIGRAVSRVGASGGGRTYRKERPAAYYFVLTMIVVVGLASVVYSRYQLEHPAAASTTYPAIGQTGYFALAVDACGTYLPDLTAGAVAGSAYTVLTDNVIQVSPTVASQAGHNANVGTFLKAKSGLTLTSSKMTLPNAAGLANPKYTYKAGTVCAKGTKDAGKKAYPELAYWNSLTQTAPSISSDPSAVVLTQNMLVTLAFVPKGVTPLLPSDATIKALLEQSPTAATTTTTVG